MGVHASPHPPREEFPPQKKLHRSTHAQSHIHHVQSTFTTFTTHTRRHWHAAVAPFIRHILQAKQDRPLDTHARTCSGEGAH